MGSAASMMRWRGLPLGVTSAWGETELQLGEVGGDGPGALITAGIHGDEGPWGGWAIHKLLQRLDARDLRGFIRVVPLANPLAMQADKRNAPVDQLDLNRAFPGDPTGSYSERIAHILAGAALEGVDAVIDMHGGGSWCVNAFVFAMAGGRELSLCFPAPFIMQALGPRRQLDRLRALAGQDGCSLSRWAAAASTRRFGRTRSLRACCARCAKSELSMRSWRLRRSTRPCR